MERPKLVVSSASSAVTPVGGPLVTTATLGSAPANSSAPVTSIKGAQTSASASAVPVAEVKRKKLEEAGKESRIDAKQVIDDLIKSANLEHDETAEGKASACTSHSFATCPFWSDATARRAHLFLISFVVLWK